jgi:glycerate kinase
VYAPQKGADEAAVELLDAGLKNVAAVIKAATGKDCALVEGAGAAGGISVPLIAFFNARLRSGIELVLDMLDFDSVIADADLIITGEGRVDSQSASGKALSGIGRRAKIRGVPCVAVCGSLGEGYAAVYESGISGVFGIQNRPMTLQESLDNCEELLTDCSERVAHLLNYVKK